MSILDIVWLQTQFSPTEPGFWLLISFVASALAGWAGRSLGAGSKRRLYMIRWVLVPYFGLIAGALSPRLLGLAYLDVLAGLRLGVLFVCAVLVLLLLVRSSIDSQPAEGAFSPTSEWSGFERIIWAGAQEFHWSFLRGAVWEILLSAPSPMPLPGYWAVWIGSLLAIPGIFRQYQRNSQRIIAGMVLILTAILFLYIQNFWLGWLLHAGAQIILGQRAALYRVPKHNHGYK